MKKIISSILVAVALTAVMLFAGCGNMNIGVELYESDDEHGEVKK